MRRFWVAALVLSVSLAAPAIAHDEHEFEPVAELARWRPAAGERVLFFPLADEFSGCVPLADPCPADSSSLLLVRAGSRPVAWQIEGSELPEVSLTTPPLRVVGTPPPEPAAARYLVPVLDGTGVGLEFLVRRLDGGRLVALDAGAAPPPSDARRLVPVSIGPPSAGTPSGQAPSRVLEPPSVVGAAGLRDMTPALLVRRAPPSRVVFGVRVGDAGWVPLVDEHGVALLARHEGRVGLAAYAGGVDAEAVAAAEKGSDEDDGDPPFVTAGRVVLVVALVAVAVGLWRRRRRSP